METKHSAGQPFSKPNSHIDFSGNNSGLRLNFLYLGQVIQSESRINDTNLVAKNKLTA
jgi:hypothetical protein